MSPISSPWVSLYPKSVHETVTTPYSSMLDAWDHQVQRRPDAPAVHYFDVTLSFEQIDQTAEGLVEVLVGRGVKPGERVAIYLQNDPQWLTTMLACWKAHAVPVAINPMLRHDELRHHLNDSGAAVLVCLESLYADVAVGVIADTPVRTVIATHPRDMAPGATLPISIADRTEGSVSGPEPISWRDTVVPTARAVHPSANLLAPQDIGVLTYTSGTTGLSKGAMNLHGAMLHSAEVYVEWWDLTAERDVVMGIAPLFHISGIIGGIGAHIVSGAPLVLLHRFDAQQTLWAIERWRGTFMLAASTAFIALSSNATLERHDVSTLTKTPSGGAPVAPALVERVRQRTGWTLRGAYGMTETTSPTHLGPPDVDPPVDHESGALSVGIPVPGCRVRIVEPETGLDVESGQVGEIVVSGPMVIPGYWGLPQESAHAIRDGWLHTGDLGMESAQGWLFVVDRLKDIINAGGYKIYPRDVEDVLYQHEAVREASVVGVPDEYRGENVQAFVSLVPGRTATELELIEFCRSRMAAYKYPRFVKILPDLPKNSSGKILRRELRTR